MLLGSGLVPQLMAPPAAQQQQFVAVLQAPQGGGNGWVVEVRVDAAGQGRLRLRPVVPPQAPAPSTWMRIWLPCTAYCVLPFCWAACCSYMAWKLISARCTGGKPARLTTSATLPRR